MQQAEIVVDAATLALTPEGTIAGAIWFRVGETDFPERGWSDFPAVVLPWWLAALEVLPCGASTHLTFVDGPYTVALTAMTADVVQATLLWTAEPVEPPVLLERSALRATVARARERVLKTCAGEGWATEDVAVLRAALSG